MSKDTLITIFLFYFSAFSQTTITGNISGMTFTPSGNPWIVMDNVFIENGSKTVIKPGCVFLFKSFTGIIVQGSIEVEGLAEMPVVFTSVNDSSYNEASVQNPEPFDWNGMVIERSAELVKMADFVLSFSVYGIKSQKDDLMIERGVFRQNGQFHFTINEKIQDVVGNVPFDYNTGQKAVISHKVNSKSWRKPAGTIFAATGTAFLGIMGYFIYSATEYNTNYGTTRNRDDIAYYTGKKDDAIRRALITGIMGGLLVPAGTGLLVWNHGTGKCGKQVSVSPVTGESSGFTVAVKF